ncbi:MAG: ester cyclase [Steroidobacteraceae bacterium]
MDLGRKVALTVALAWLTSGCATRPDGRTPTVLDHNRSVVMRVFDDILNRQRYDLFDTLYALDFVKHIDGHDETLAEEIVDAKSMYQMSTDLIITVDAIIASGDLVATRYTGRGTHNGHFGALPPSGRHFELSGMTFYRLRDGRIIEEWTTYNESELLRQLGVGAAAGPGSPGSH